MPAHVRRGPVPAARRPTDDQTWYLRDVDVLRDLDDAAVAELAAITDVQTIRAGEPIIDGRMVSERVYVVRRGTVRLYHRGADGREITVDVLGQGRLFGVSALFGPARDELLAEAATDVVLCQTEGREMLRIITRFPRVMLNLIQQVGARVLEMERRLDRIAATDARTRLASALYRLSRDAGADVPGGRAIQATLTHAALGRQIGASRETVTRLLAALEDDGHIRRLGRRLVVTDVARLARVFHLES